MNPFFSVIIPLFNKQDYILSTLRTVLTQTFQDFEVIIIDDGCTDNSVPLANTLTDSRIRIIHQKNQGVSVARNHGVSISKGAYIALLDADDLWLPEHLQELYKLINRFPKAGLYCNRYAIKYSSYYTKNTAYSAPVPEGMSIIKDYFMTSLLNPIAWTSAVAFNGTIFKNIGCFDEKLRTGQDIDLWIRFAILHKIAFNNVVTMIYNKDTYDNLSKTEHNKQRDYFINKYQKEEATNTSLKKYLDQNRFAIAIRSKIVGHYEISKKQIKEIDHKNLNVKQKIFLKSPGFILRLLSKIHRFLIRKNIYITPLQ